MKLQFNLSVILMQYTTGGVKDSLPSTELTWNVCAVCEREIITDGSSVERTYRLTCDHLYLLSHRVFSLLNLRENLYLYTTFLTIKLR